MQNLKIIFQKHHSHFLALRSSGLALGLGFILLVGAYLRLYNISGYMTFLGDEGRDVLIVKRMIVDHKFTLLGPNASVGGFFLGPIYYYFMLPFLWLWKLDPTGPAVMVALFGIATIYLVYKAGKEFYDEWVGLIAASLYAVSPLVIAYSRSSWNPNPVPFFSTLLLLFLWRVVVRNRWKEMFWVGIIFGIGLQLHYLFAFLFFVAGIWFLIFGRSLRNLKYYVLGIAGFLIGYAPFLAFEMRHSFPNTMSIIRFLFAGKETGFVESGFIRTISDVVFRLFGRLIVRLPQPELWSSFPLWQRQAWELWVNGSIALTIGISLCFIFYKSLAKFLIPGMLKDFLDNEDKRNELYKSSVLLLVWFVVIILLFGFYRKSIYDYYFGIFFALPFLATGLILWRISRVRFGKYIAVALWIGLLYFNWQGRPFRFPPNNQLDQAKRIASFAFEKTDRKPFNFALITGGNSDHGFRYFFEIWGNPPVVLENEERDPQRKTVTDQLIVICEYFECKPLGHPLWEIAGFGPAEIVGQWDVPFVKIFKLIHVSKATK